MPVNNWILVFCIICSVSYNPVHAQSIDLDQQIAVPKGSVLTSALLRQLSRDAGIRFSYRPGELKTSALVAIRSSPQSIRTILQHISRQQQLSYRVLGKHVILQPTKPSARPPVTSSRFVKDMSQQQELIIRTPTLVRTRPMHDPGYNVAVKVVERPFKFPTSSIELPKPDFSNSTKKMLLLLQAGIRSDEVLYSGVEFHAGLRPLFLMASWVTDYRISGFRYGVGSSAAVNDNLTITTTFTVGELVKNFNVDTFVTRTIKVTGSLYRFSLSIDKNFGNRFSLKFGPVYNFLKTSYYYNGNKQTLSGVPGVRGDVDKSFHTSRPLYLITNTFRPESPVNTKSWIGLQLLVMYKF